jgi:hypothetical protein
MMDDCPRRPPSGPDICLPGYRLDVGDHAMSVCVWDEPIDMTRDPLERLMD